MPLKKRLRVLGRRMRETPVVGHAVRVADRVLWARVILRSDLIDPEYYAAQRGWQSASAARCVHDYVRRGFRAGRSLNPLFDELVAGRYLPEPDRVPGLYAYLVSDRRTVTVHPWWRLPQDVEADAPPLEWAWAHRVAGVVDVQVGTVVRSTPIAELRAWAIAAARSLRTGHAESPAPEGTSGDVVVRLLQRRDRDYPRRAVSAAEASADVPVVLGVVGAEPSQWASLDVVARLVSGVALRPVDGSETFAAAVTACVPTGLAGTICVVDSKSDVSAEEMHRLRAGAMTGRPVAPAQLAGDGTIASVGAAGTATAHPYRILRGHPQEDLEQFGGATVEVPLLAGRTFAITVADWTTAGGLRGAGDDSDALETMTARLRRIDGSFTCAIDTGIVSTAYARDSVFAARRRTTRQRPFADDRAAAARVLALGGFDVVEWETHGGTVTPRLSWRRPDPDALRWAVKVCSPPGPAGAVWGDTHFAHGLAKALRRLGQTAIVDSFDARDRPSSYLDDVTIVIRGPYRITPPASGVRMEWIISHPDLVTAREMRAFDAVFAASARWSRSAAQRWGVPVTPLLECTDADQFFPRGLERTDEIVFVGTARGIARPSVVVPLRAGIPVRVYGPDWRTYIPAAAIVANSIPNSELSARYETASVVLNDQWPAMRREGFMAMRLFDATAAGGRVISEDVDGISEVFGDAVPVFRSDEELLELLRADPADVFPDADAIQSLSERIRREHSFDARAAELLREARRLGAGKLSGDPGGAR